MEVKPKVEYAVNTYLPEIVAAMGMIYAFLGLLNGRIVGYIIFIHGSIIVIAAAYTRYDVGYNND